MASSSRSQCAMCWISTLTLSDLLYTVRESLVASVVGGCYSVSYSFAKDAVMLTTRLIPPVTDRPGVPESCVATASSSLWSCTLRMSLAEGPAGCASWASSRFAGSSL